MDDETLLEGAVTRALVRPGSHALTGLHFRPDEGGDDGGGDTGDDTGGADDDAADQDDDQGVDDSAAAGNDTGDDAAVAAWAGPSQQEWEAQQAALAQLHEYTPVLGQLGEALSQADRAAQPDPFAGLADLNPLDDNYTERFAGGILGAIGQLLDQRLGPVNNLVENQAEQEAQQQVNTWLTAAATPHGDLIDDTGKSVAEMLAFGVAVKDKTGGDQAVNKAVGLVAQMVKDARKQGREQLLAEQKTKANAGREVRGTGGAVDVAGAPKSLVEAAHRFAERQALRA